MEEKYKQLMKLIEDEDTAKELLPLSPEEVVETLKNQYGLEFSIDEINDVANGLRTALDDNSNELSEEALESVIGGKSTAYNVGYYLGKTVKAGAAIYSVYKGIVLIGAALSW